MKIKKWEIEDMTKVKEKMTLEDCVVLLADLKCQFAEFKEMSTNHINNMGTQIDELRETVLQQSRLISRIDTDFKEIRAAKPISITC